MLGNLIWKKIGILPLKCVEKSCSSNRMANTTMVFFALVAWKSLCKSTWKFPRPWKIPCLTYQDPSVVWPRLISQFGLILRGESSNSVFCFVLVRATEKIKPGLNPHYIQKTIGAFNVDQVYLNIKNL